MFPGQHYVPRMPQGSQMENEMLRPPGNLNTGFLDQSSRGKSFNTNQPAPVFPSTNEYNRPLGYNHQNGSFSGIHEQNQAYELNSNQSRTTGSTAFLNQFGKDQFHYHNGYPAPSLTNNMNFPNGNLNLCNAPLPPAPQSGPFRARTTNFTMNDNNYLGYATLPPPPRSGSLDPSKMNCIPNGNHNFGTVPLPSHSQPSSYGESLASGNMHAADGAARSIWQSQAWDVAGMRQSNQLLSSGGGNDVSNPKNLPQNQVQFGRMGSFGVPSNQIAEIRRQETGDGAVKEMEKMIESAVKNLVNYSLPGVSSISCDAPKYTETTQKMLSTSVSLSSNGKDSLAVAKASSTVAEKLWEGSLQLSSTVTVSSVAYFKSGEKLQNSNWFNSVEVKGKVRLEAFEKYIQDLPCSRNKGLMVISLSLKEGSSASGAKGMMEVAKGYTKGKRVGFAHLSREIHLYICPRSEAIITILAKYGFYKGMAAIEDKPDSMIGCVIWRKSRTSDSVAKKPVTKKNKAPSESSEQDSDLEDSPLTQLIQEIVAPLSTTFEKGGKCSESDLGKTQSAVNETLTGTQRDLTMVNDQPVKKLRTEQSEGNFNFINPIVPSPEIITMVNDQPVKKFRTEQPEGNFNFPNPIRSPEIVKEKMSLGDDIDDLPEFDFMATGKPSLSRNLPTGVQEIEQPNLLQIPAFTPSEKSTVTFRSSRNLFDDMPEWCPPDHHNQSKFPVSHFENSPRGPPFSPQGFGPVGHFHTPQVRPLQRGPSSENGSHSNSNLGAPPGFDTKLPFNRADKQGWGSR